MHQPVMLNEVMEGLALRPGDRAIDATVGGGGHSRAILQAIGPTGTFLGLDRDSETLSSVRQSLTNYPRAHFIHATFDLIDTVAGERGMTEVEAILFDLGFSSLQLDEASRGFSFQQDGPLDMRLDRHSSMTAADLINRSSERNLADIFQRYGDLYDARRLAKRIVEARRQSPIRTTGQLVAILGLSNPGVKAKLFQAVRIAVNDEVGQLERAIPAALSLLASGGRLAIITFHSLEDRIVKVAIRDNHLLSSFTKKPILPSQAEIDRNPRSRSAKLRLAIKNPLPNP